MLNYDHAYLAIRYMNGLGCNNGHQNSFSFQTLPQEAWTRIFCFDSHVDTAISASELDLRPSTSDVSMQAFPWAGKPPVADRVVAREGGAASR